MLGASLVLDLFVLLAATRAGNNNNGSGRGRGRGGRGDGRSPSSSRDFESAGESDVVKKGRQRYAPDGSRRVASDRPRPQQDGRGRGRGRGGRGGARRRDDTDQQEDILPAVPPLTVPDGPFPTYFTCRHTFEETLVEEINHYRPSVDVASVYPGLVRAEGLYEEDASLWDPVYALQWLPNCRVLECENSIKGLARAIAEEKSFAQLLVGAPRGSLAIHALVPGMCKGQTTPKLQRRSYLVAEAVEELWKKQFPAARNKPKAIPSQDHLDSTPPTESSISPHLLLQIMLLSPDVAAVSLARCKPTTSTLELPPESSQQQQQLWPNPHYPVGMARVDIRDIKMPSSAYRKLLEAFGCWGCKPSGQDTFVDLGASPGGWTAALILYCDGLLDHDDDGAATDTNANDVSGGSGIHVYAIDRSPLDRKLMNDPRVTFVQGDAFTFEPEEPVTWMVSDIISYPERIVELIDLWCRKQLANNMIVTMKFQGSEPTWDQLDQALQVAKSYNYEGRAKHFFNNKNEVTLMLRRQRSKSGGGELQELSTISTIGSFYKRVRAAA